MRYLAFWLVAALTGASAATASELAPTGTLRAAFIGSNPVHGRVEASGEVRGPVADLTRALVQRLGLPFGIAPAQSAAAVIEAVKSGNADIGFVAFDPTRAEQVDFSQPYLLVHNSYIVRTDSSFAASQDLDRPNIRIGVGERDAGDLYLTCTVKSAQLSRRPSAEIATGRSEERRVGRGSRCRRWASK